MMLGMGDRIRVGSLRVAATAVCLACCFSGGRAVARDDAKRESTKTYRLWEGDAPGSLGKEAVDIPTVTVYSPPADKASGAAVVVCPGGGYGMLADHEGRPVAEWLNSIGIVGIVLKYRLGPKYHHPVMLNDAARAIRFTRAHASEWKIDPHKVGILGFSAGGHLASTAATHFDSGKADATDPIEKESSRPDLAILIYPVVAIATPYGHAGSKRNLLGDNPPQDLVESLSNERMVTKETPPMFLVHTADDAGVPVENSLLLAESLRKARVPVELHVFEHGPHGFGMGGNDPVLKTWPDLCSKWLKRKGFYQ